MGGQGTDFNIGKLNTPAMIFVSLLWFRESSLCTHIQPIYICMWDPVCAQSQSLRHVLEGTHTHTPHSVNIFRNSSVLLNNQLLITSPRNDNKHTSASTASNTQTLHHLLQLGEVIESACRDRCQLVENKIKDPVGTYTYDPLVFVSKILSGLHSLITLFWLSYHLVLTLWSPCFDSLITLFWLSRHLVLTHSLWFR